MTEDKPIPAMDEHGVFTFTRYNLMNQYVFRKFDVGDTLIMFY